MSELLIFLSESLICSFLDKNERFARKSNERIPSPEVYLPNAFTVAQKIVQYNYFCIKKGSRCGQIHERRDRQLCEHCPFKFLVQYSLCSLFSQFPSHSAPFSHFSLLSLLSSHSALFSLCSLLIVLPSHFASFSLCSFITLQYTLLTLLPCYFATFSIYSLLALLPSSFLI